MISTAIFVVFGLSCVIESKDNNKDEKFLLSLVNLAGAAGWFWLALYTFPAYNLLGGLP